MNANDQAVIHSSSDSNWRTPDPCFATLDREFDFVLDAAATSEDRKCFHYFGPDHEDPALRDALQVDWYDWLGKGAIFLNPPFSREAYRQTKNPAMLIENWAHKCWEESRKGSTIVAILPFAPQTDWYRRYVYGHGRQQKATKADTAGITISNFVGWNGHAAQQERRLPHRIGFLRPDGTPAGNAGVNSAVIVWSPMRGVVGPWQPHTFYWTYRGAAQA